MNLQSDIVKTSHRTIIEKLLEEAKSLNQKPATRTVTTRDVYTGAPITTIYFSLE